MDGEPAITREQAERLSARIEGLAGQVSLLAGWAQRLSSRVDKLGALEGHVLSVSDDLNDLGRYIRERI